MPTIQSIDITKNSLILIDYKGKYVFDTSKIPPDKDSILKLETYLNDEWLPPLTRREYQTQVKVFSLSPLKMSCAIADDKEIIPQNWWVDTNVDDTVIPIIP